MVVVAPFALYGMVPFGSLVFQGQRDHRPTDAARGAGARLARAPSSPSPPRPAMWHIDGFLSLADAHQGAGPNQRHSTNRILIPNAFDGSSITSPADSDASSPLR